MTQIILPRRRFLAGLVGLVAAPAVIRVADLMAVKPIPLEIVTRQDYERYGILMADLHRITREEMIPWLYREQYTVHPLIRLIRE